MLRYTGARLDEDGGRRRKSGSAAAELADFTTGWRVVPCSLLAIGIGLLGSLVAVGLLRLIGLFTNLFFYQRWDTSLVSPAGHRLGPWVVLVPVAGALLIGLMSRYGSERIRGHGIPEAIEAILLRGGRVEPKVALLKPLSAAISIGSGGPFGAEGPIIMTGGAFGSLVAQLVHLTSAERRTLLVAGAAAGMSATFATPLAAVLLSVELPARRARRGRGRRGPERLTPRRPVPYTPLVMPAMYCHGDARKRATRKRTSRLGGGVALCP